MHKVTLYNLDKVSLNDVFDREAIDIVIHCATDYGRNAHNPYALLSTNLMLPVRLLMLCRKKGGATFVNTDSMLDRSVSQYALSKHQFKEWMKIYAGDIVCINMALEHFYGPNEDDSKFVKFIIKQLLGDADRIALTPGEQQRDFIYIDDVVNAFVKVLESNTSKAGFYGYEVGTNRNISIKEFVKMVKRLTANIRTQLDFGSIPYRENEVMKSAVDTTAICRLGWMPKVSLEDGVRETISHVMERNNK